MVNTVNGKSFHINGKTDSRNFYKDKSTLINHFPNKKSNSKSIWTVNTFWQNDCGKLRSGKH